MRDLREETADRKLWTAVALFLLAGIPAIVLRLSGAEVDPLIASLIYGLGIVGGAFLLSWAAEVAQLDVSASFAIAVLALVAILPEYAIEAVLAWDAGASFNTETRELTDEMSRVAANVTGSNRLLIGLGWSVVILIYWLKRRRTLDMRGEAGPRDSIPHHRDPRDAADIRHAPGPRDPGRRAYRPLRRLSVD